MNLTRYELYFQGESQEVGFLKGLQQLSPSEARYFLSRFDDELPLPNFSNLHWEKQKEYPASYFTEEGISFFKKDINDILSYYENFDEGFEIKKLEIFLENKDDVIYEDQFQVIVKQPFIT